MTGRLWHKQGKVFLVVYAVVAVNLLFHRVGKGQLDKFPGGLYGGRDIIAPCDSGAQAGGKKVSGAGVAAAYVREGEHFISILCGVEVSHLACACIIREPDAGHDDVLKPPPAQRLGEGADFYQQVLRLPGLRDAAVIRVCEKAKLRHVGRDDICLKGKLFHQGEEGVGKHVIGNPVISHDRVYQKETAFLVESAKEPEDLPYLLLACHEPGVDAVKLCSHLLPFMPEVLHLVCAVAAIVAGITGLGA